MAAEDRGPEVIAVIVIFLVFTWIAVLLRCYCRIVIVKSFFYDDWLAVIAVVFFTLWSGFSWKDVHEGTGRHFLAIVQVGGLPQYAVGLKWWWICEPVYTISSVATKWSICIYLLRICVSRWQRMAIYSLMVLIGAFGLAYLFISIFQCLPVEYFWTQALGAKGTCVSTDFIVDAVYVYSAFAVFIDWSLAIIPIFLVYNLQMNTKAKISVAGILGLGAIASAATIARMPYIHTLRDTTDFLYGTTDIAIWSMVETGLGIVAAAIATLRPMFKKGFFGGSNNGSRGWKSYGSRKSTGYVRSGDTSTNKNDIKLDDSIGGLSPSGVTTVIESGFPERRHRLERLSEGSHPEWPPGGSSFLDDDHEWDNSPGIRKTMVVTTSAV